MDGDKFHVRPNDPDARLLVNGNEVKRSTTLSHGDRSATLPGSSAYHCTNVTCLCLNVVCSHDMSMMICVGIRQ